MSRALRPRAPWEELARMAGESFGLALGPAELEPLRRFVAELVRWSARTNLVSMGSTEEIVSRHVLDSLAAAPLLPAAGVVVDVGSGAGFPGVPLAVCRPGPIRLIESRRRRATFLRHVVRHLGLAGAEVFEGRAEDFAEAASAIVSRAVRPEVAAGLGRRLLAPGGRVLLFEKQAAPIPEMDGFSAAAGPAYELPGKLRHRITVLERFT